MLLYEYKEIIDSLVKNHTKISKKMNLNFVIYLNKGFARRHLL